MGNLPTSLAFVDASALIFKLPDSTFAIPSVVYPQEAPCASCAILIYYSCVNLVAINDEIPACFDTLFASIVDSAADTRSGCKMKQTAKVVPNNLISFRSVEHTSELQPHSQTSHAIFCLKQKK